MNETFEPDEAPRPPRPAPAIELAYDDELDIDDPAFRYVIKRASQPRSDVDSPPRPGRGGGTL